MVMVEGAFLDPAEGELEVEEELSETGQVARLQQAQRVQPQSVKELVPQVHTLVQLQRLLQLVQSNQ